MKYSVSKGVSVLVDDKYCADQQKPATRELCHGDCLLPSWHYTEWSEVRHFVFALKYMLTSLLISPDALFPSNTPDILKANNILTVYTTVYTTKH